MAFFQFPLNAYILDLTDGSYLPFQFMPDDIADTKQAQYTDYPIVGRSIPFRAYSGSGARTVTLTLQFFTAPIEGFPAPTPDIIKLWIDKLRSYTYPDYRQGILPPHRVMLRIGFSIAMESIITQYNATPSKTWFGPGPILPHGHSIQLTFEEIRAVPLSYNEVASYTAGFGFGAG